MINVSLDSPTKEDIRWAVDREFVHLPAVDPVFAPGSMSGVRAFLLRRWALPTRFRQMLEGRILRVDGVPAGYVFWAAGPVALTVESLAVEEEYRRQGYGRVLLDEVTAQVEEGEERYLAASVTPENEPANAFFEKHRFRPYRPQLYRVPGGFSPEIAHPESGLAAVQPRELMPVYRHWLSESLKHGDPEVEDLISEEHFKMALRTRALHWRCTWKENEVGYLRIARQRGGLEAYLATGPDFWAHEAALDWLRLGLTAMRAIGLAGTRLYLGSGGQFVAGKTLWEPAGFIPQRRPRYLMVRPLEI